MKVTMRSLGVMAYNMSHGGTLTIESCNLLWL
jgi:hypothetical protein